MSAYVLFILLNKLEKREKNARAAKHFIGALQKFIKSTDIRAWLIDSINCIIYH